jgi:nicotinamidase-related amidase
MPEGETMPKNTPVHSSLIDVADCCLVLIDVQKVFLGKLPKNAAKKLVRRLAWLLKVAVRLGVPVVATAEDIGVNGSLVSKLAKALPPDTTIHNKLSFDLSADPAILGAVRDTGRGTAVLVGLETDVCVAHSAMGLLGQGYRVVVLRDAAASPGAAHAYGLARIQGAGALISDVKSLYYEWLRTVPACREFEEKFGGELGDPGLTL